MGRRRRAVEPSPGNAGAAASSPEPDSSVPEHVHPGRGHHTPPSVLQRLFDPSRIVINAARGEIAPAWRRVTKGEPRLPVTIAILVAIGLQASLPNRVANQPRWVLPGLGGGLLGGIVFGHPTAIN